MDTSKDTGGATPDDGQTLVEGPDHTVHGGDSGAAPASDDDGIGKDDAHQGDATVDEDQSKGAVDHPGPQSAKGAFVNDEGIDLNEEADHGPTVQGNKYPFGQDAAANYRDEADARIKELEREIETLKTQRDQWDAQAKGQEPEDIGGSQSHTVKDED